MLKITKNIIHNHEINTVNTLNLNFLDLNITSTKLNEDFNKQEDMRESNCSNITI